MNVAAAIADVRAVGLDGLEALAPEWDALAAATGASIFCRPGWIGAWWSAFGSGELQVFVARREGELSGVLPLWRRRGRLHGCANIHSPLFEAVARGEEDLEALVAAALAAAPGGLAIACLDPAGPLARAMRRQAGGGATLLEAGRAISSRIAHVERERFEAGLARKRRSEMRRSWKLLAKKGEPRHGEVDVAMDLERHLDEFLRLEGSEWKRRQGTAIAQSPEALAFYREMPRWAASIEALRLSFIWVGERAVSTELSLDDGQRRFALKTGFDAEFSRCGPGILQVVEDVYVGLERGQSIELGVGGEPLKVELRDETWPLVELVLFPGTPRGRLAHLLSRARARALRRARESERLRSLRDKARERRAAGLWRRPRR